MAQNDDKKRNDNNAGPQGAPPRTRAEAVTAEKSLADALRISFFILKLIILVLLAFFLLSGLVTVDSGERAIVLRFGKIRGIGEERILGPGLHWVFPYPVEQVIKINVGKTVSIPVNTFWYYQRPEELITEQSPRRVGATLDPLQDGYCLTRASREREDIPGTTESDYSITHARWQFTYQVDNPERFFRNVLVQDVKPGQIYLDVITESIKPLLTDIFESSVVTATVHYSIDEIISGKASRLTREVEMRFQQKLAEINSGIRVVSVQLATKTWPRQVDDAFQAALDASNTKRQAITEAKTYAENALNEASGPVAERLYDALTSDADNQGDVQQLWSQVAGRSQQIIADAVAYRRKVVESARANANYLEAILPEYRKHPKLVVRNIYQDTMEKVFENTQEKMITQYDKSAENKEVRILINRDPSIKRTRSQQKEQD